MSISATFYVLRKDKFEEFRELASLSPPRKSESVKTVGRTVAVRPENMDTIRQSDEWQVSEKIGSFLKANAKKPFSFKWGGNVMDDLLKCLNKFKNIDLSQQRIENENGRWSFYVVDNKTKKKYLKQLIPSGFNESEMLEMYSQIQGKHSEDLLSLLKSTGRQFDEAQIAQMIQARVTDDDFSERGKALMDGIDSLHRFFSLVDDEHVVLLHIG